jgi:hypothetical protein
VSPFPAKETFGHQINPFLSKRRESYREIEGLPSLEHGAPRDAAITWGWQIAALSVST